MSEMMMEGVNCLEAKKLSTEKLNENKLSEFNLIFGNRIACEWLNTKEAAHFLSITENALRIMVYRGQIPFFKFGRRLRFRRQDCQALFKTKGV